jgi:hypothetical protein
LWGGQAGDVAGIELNVSGAWAHKAEYHLHRGGFAAGIAAEQGDDLSAWDAEIETEMDLDRAVERIDTG